MRYFKQPLPEFFLKRQKNSGQKTSENGILGQKLGYDRFFVIALGACVRACVYASYFLRCLG